MIDLSTLPEGTPLWFTLGMVAIFSLLIFSERVAKIRGPIGALARWWDDRQKDEIDRIQAASDKIDAAAERRYGARVRQLEESMSRLDHDLKEERQERRREKREMADRHEGQRLRIERERDLFAAWAEHILTWWRTQAQWLAEQGIILPPPDLPVFSQFRKDWMSRNPIPFTGARTTVMHDTEDSSKEG